jgi:ABC-type Fe3+/spermidine/putrescine transport system ATPase subunit
VLNHGSIEQVGGPIEVYERPRTPFVAGFIGVSNLIERDGHVITVRPEKITLIEDGQPEPLGTHVEPGRVRDVIYAGVLTRYAVDLDAGGGLVVSRQNTEPPVLAQAGQPAPPPAGAEGPASGTPAARPGIGPGARVRLAWRPDQAFTIPQQTGQGSRPGEGNP